MKLQIFVRAWQETRLRKCRHLKVALQKVAGLSSYKTEPHYIRPRNILWQAWIANCQVRHKAWVANHEGQPQNNPPQDNQPQNDEPQPQGAPDIADDDDDVQSKGQKAKAFPQGITVPDAKSPRLSSKPDKKCYKTRYGLPHYEYMTRRTCLLFRICLSPWSTPHYVHQMDCLVPLSIPFHLPYAQCPHTYEPLLYSCYLPCSTYSYAFVPFTIRLCFLHVYKPM